MIKRDEAWWPSGLSRLLSKPASDSESGRRQTVPVTACTLWQGSLNLSATSQMTTSDAETDVKLNIYFIYFLFISTETDRHVTTDSPWEIKVPGLS